jgi:hypothetical protein
VNSEGFRETLSEERQRGPKGDKMAENNAWGRGSQRGSSQPRVEGREKPHQLCLHSQLGEGEVFPLKKRGNYIIPSRHEALKPMSKQEEGLSSERRRKLS